MSTHYEVIIGDNWEKAEEVREGGVPTDGERCRLVTLLPNDKKGWAEFIYKAPIVEEETVVTV